jgi:hypothetical protein
MKKAIASFAMVLALGACSSNHDEAKTDESMQTSSTAAADTTKPMTEEHGAATTAPAETATTEAGHTTH